jgi:adenine C2-methylase RlmN of 23S rRNA A2503 and tRNA A37
MLIEKIDTTMVAQNAAGFAALIRMPRGQDILSACGQLRPQGRRQRGG